MMEKSLLLPPLSPPTDKSFLSATSETLWSGLRPAGTFEFIAKIRGLFVVSQKL
jgi:hypothetical protein